MGSFQTRVYGAVHGFWQVESAELADGPTRCSEVARGGCLFVCLELQFDKINCTYRGREKNYTRAGETFCGRCPNCQ